MESQSVAQGTGQEYCTPAEAALILGRHRHTVWAYIREGLLPAERVGPRRLRIKVTDLEAIGQPVTPQDPIREAALRVVSETPELTAEQLDEIRNLLGQPK